MAPTKLTVLAYPSVPSMTSLFLTLIDKLKLYLIGFLVCNGCSSSDTRPDHVKYSVVLCRIWF